MTVVVLPPTLPFGRRGFAQPANPKLMDPRNQFARGLKARWLLNSLDGVDLSSFGSLLSFPANASFVPAPRGGKALALNGSTQYGVANNVVSLTSSVVTVSLWGYMIVAGQYFRYIDMGDGVNNVQIIFDAGSSVLTTKHTQYETGLNCTTWGAVGFTTWYHIVVVFDAINSVTTCYVNGVKQTTSSFGTVAGAITGTTQTFLGVRSDLNAVTFMGGYLENVSIYQRGLSKTEIEYLYNVEPYAGLVPMRVARTGIASGGPAFKPSWANQATRIIEGVG